MSGLVVELVLQNPGRVDDRLPVQRIRPLTSPDLSAGSTAPHRKGNRQPSDLRKRLAGSADVIPNAYHVPIGKPVPGLTRRRFLQVGAAGARPCCSFGLGARHGRNRLRKGRST